MAKGKRTIVKQEQRQVASNLLNALKFISIAQIDESDNSNETHCILGDRRAVAFNGVLAAGHFIDEDLICAPHTMRLIDGLERCGADLAIMQTGDTITLRSQKFRVAIPCMPVGVLQHIWPDNPIATVNDMLKDGFKVVSCLVADKSEYVITASILLRAGSMVSTNRHVIMEFWHGIDLPPMLAIPKAAAMAVAKCAKKLVALGFSDHSVTFWFDDQSWIRTQRYHEEWPDVDKVLGAATKSKPLPTLFYAAVNCVLPFCEQDDIHIGDGVVRSHIDALKGATYECDGLPRYACFNPKYLKLIEPYVQHVDWDTYENMVYFYGQQIRGVVAGRHKRG
jgi:hypothetical protein